MLGHNLSYVILVIRRGRIYYPFLHPKYCNCSVNYAYLVSISYCYCKKRFKKTKILCFDDCGWCEVSRKLTSVVTEPSRSARYPRGVTEPDWEYTIILLVRPDVSDYPPDILSVTHPRRSGHYLTCCLHQYLSCNRDYRNTHTNGETASVHLPHKTYL